MHTQNHHIRPVSIGWPDIKQNIASVSIPHHKQIHDILNIPYSKIRNLKQYLNNRMYKDSDYIQREFEVLQYYFENIDRLPRHLQQLHLDKMGEMKNLRINELKKDLQRLTHYQQQGAIINIPRQEWCLAIPQWQITDKFWGELRNVEHLEKAKAQVRLQNIIGKAQSQILDTVERELERIW